jgi:hypothetical protein
MATYGSTLLSFVLRISFSVFSALMLVPWLFNLSFWRAVRSSPKVFNPVIRFRRWKGKVSVPDPGPVPFLDSGPALFLDPGPVLFSTVF